MAIKVIKPGKKPETHRMEGMCNNCSCVIECERGDTEEFHDQREGSFYSVKCPTCGKVMYVNPMK